MSTDPFRVPTPGCINFSGGRTSAFMLWEIIEAYSGKLPPDLHVIFCNTGKERPETLDFVQECSQRWNVPIVWLEYDPEAEHQTKIVNHNSAARDGEPFEALIRSRQYLPNPVARFCTSELKVFRAYNYMIKLLKYESYTSVIGLRYDEMRRVARLKGVDWREECETPLARSGMTKQDVAEFWDKQEFDLVLPLINNTTPHGNCDLCFLKSRSTIAALIHENPASADWWASMEAMPLNSNPEGGRFRYTRDSYAKIRDQVERQAVFDFGDESGIDCFCTD